MNFVIHCEICSFWLGLERVSACTHSRKVHKSPNNIHRWCRESLLNIFPNHLSSLPQSESMLCVYTDHTEISFPVRNLIPFVRADFFLSLRNSRFLHENTQTFQLTTHPCSFKFFVGAPLESMIFQQYWMGFILSLSINHVAWSSIGLIISQNLELHVFNKELTITWHLFACIF